MATASKRITRKQLRQPDWFQVSTENALEYFNRHKSLVFAALAGLLLLGAAIWGWQIFKQRQNVAAAREFTKAMELYQSDKHREAIAAFENVKNYRWSRYSVLAHLYLAHSYLATNDLDRAVSEAQRSLAATRPNSLYRQIALVTLATAEERKKQCKAAIEHYSEAQNIAAALQSRAMLGKARCAEELGDSSTALTAYKEYLKENPGSPLAMKVAELEARGTAAPASK
ncbi:MAG: tetratricopeptide repeat protein [Candidatus Binatia bacterium]